MTDVAAPPSSATPTAVRVRIFVDFWNFHLAVKRHNGGKDFNMDWRLLGPWLTQHAGSLALVGDASRPLRYEGMHVYMSIDPRQSSRDGGLKKWAGVIDRFPGVQVVMKERKPKEPPSCPVCHGVIKDCPHCGKPQAGMIEKGIDTAIVTDMIKLAWEDAYDVAVLASADRDFIPAVEFLDAKGRKVVHVGIPPHGMDLARRCWSSLDLRKGLGELERGKGR
ncbi:MAG TPA: NYN domain-containing protein [Polyangiaceae bacterium]|jgi:hypothetical protein